jgi:hypothetical protein
VAITIGSCKGMAAQLSLPNMISGLS